jgi:hypothetical protein
LGENKNNSIDVFYRLSKALVCEFRSFDVLSRKNMASAQIARAPKPREPGLPKGNSNNNNIFVN